MGYYNDDEYDDAYEYDGDYSGTYAHDIAGYSDDDINDVFDGDPEAYWNIN